MKITYLHQYFRLPTDGGSSRTYEMARHLASYGHDVHVVTTDWRCSKPDLTWKTNTYHHFTVHEVGIPYRNTMGFNERMKRFAQFALLSSSKARELNGDVIFATSTPLTIAIPAIWAKIGRKVPLVFEVRDLWPQIPIELGALRNPVLKIGAKLLERIAYMASDFIVALSPDMKAGIERLGVPSERIALIPNASDNDMFDSVSASDLAATRSVIPVKDDSPILLYCGTIGIVNDVPYLARVARELLNQKSNVQIVVVGEGNDESRLVDVAKELKVLAVNLHLLRPVAKSQVPPLFNLASATISTVQNNPVLFANSANKVFDSFAAGRPVFINHPGWQKALLESSGAGISIPYSDPACAAKTLHEVLNDEHRLLEMGRQAKKLGVGAFSRKGLGGRLAVVLEAAVKQHEKATKRLPCEVQGITRLN